MNIEEGDIVQYEFSVPKQVFRGVILEVWVNTIVVKWLDGSISEISRDMIA